MNHYTIFQLLFISLVCITLTSGRSVYYNQLNDDANSKSVSTEEEDILSFESKLSNMNNDYNERESFDSYEERKFHQRALFSTSRAPHTISTHTRQAIIDILQKAFDQGWRPNLKHYIPATRFGRHRR